MQTIEQTYFFKGTTPAEVYEAYMNEEKHSAFTGSECAISTAIGGKCSYYDGYIEAENLQLKPGKLIEQYWVAMEEDWPAGHRSKLTLIFEGQENGTLMTCAHTQVPDLLRNSLAQGWIDYYWEPMAAFFSQS